MYRRNYVHHTHTYYIHKYMRIRDMLRHVEWLGFWMNFDVIKTKTISDPLCLAHTWICPTLLRVDACVYAGSHKGVCWKILDCQKDVAVISKWLPKPCAAWDCWSEAQRNCQQRVSHAKSQLSSCTNYQSYTVPHISEGIRCNWLLNSAD